MSEQELLALSPVDGRYAKITEPLRAFCNEYALIRYRLQVEIAWFKQLASLDGLVELQPLEPADEQWLAELAAGFTIADAVDVKASEAITNHDVKAVEYFLKKKMATRTSLAAKTEFVHFGCTSEDINNLAYALMLEDVRSQVLLPVMRQLITNLAEAANSFADDAMLARTHGQVASPTTMGKELANTAARLTRQTAQFQALRVLGKMNGAVGNYNAQVAAYPNLDWPAIGKAFVESLGVDFNAYTTQIEPHDYIAEYCQILGRFNRILIDYNRDTWGYISLGYFKQKQQPGETGSSTMPHKINPIDFENSEGNLNLANALFECFADKLPISRWQRDLTDSTLLRNLGTSFAHTLTGWQASLRGMGKLELNPQELKADLDRAWEVLAEPIQTLMRKHGEDSPYEKMKRITRGVSVDKHQMLELIQVLDLPPDAKATLARLRPENYTGLAAKLARQFGDNSEE